MPVTADLVVVNGEQTQIPYNALWCQIIVFPDVAVYEFRVLVFRAETVDIHSYRLQILRALTYNSKLARANQVKVCVRYYTPCTDHNGFAWQMLGQYVTATGICWKVDPEETGAIKIDEAVIPLADAAEITASDESLFKKDEWEGC